ncbi:MAG: hypothetical protein LUC85_00510 [Bacteroidales bacterium]|nr:hypothetical protein [Bacteroidales bacterium]
MDLLFSSVENIPGVRGRAAFTVNSQAVFKEDIDTLPTVIDSKLSYMPWGADNQMPYDIIDLIEKDETLATCQLFNAEVCYRSGLQYDCAETSAAVADAVDEFLLSNDLPAYFLGVCQNFKHFGFAVSVIILNADGTLAALLPHLDWLTAMPTVPVRLSRINRREAVAADFQGVAFGDYIVADNLYQGYLHTQASRELSVESREKITKEIFEQLTAVLYPALNSQPMTLNDEERVSVFYWLAGLKALFAAKWPDFFTPLATDEQRQFADHETDA